MKQEFLGLRTLIYQVADLPATTEWYTRALGFGPYFNEPFYVGFNVGGYELGLHPGDPAQGPTTYWGVEDVQLSYDRLIAEGATSVEAPSEVGGGIVVASVKDPFGNILGLIYNPHFKL